MASKNWPTVACYCVAVVCATYLTAAGKLPTELLAALLAVALPSPFTEKGSGP